MFSPKIRDSMALLRFIRKHNAKKTWLFLRQASSEVSMPSESHISSSVIERTAKPKTNVPFTKEFFLGRFDPKLLMFPEVANTDELLALNEKIKPIEAFFKETDLKQIDTDSKIPDDVMQQLKEFGLFGQQIPEEYGGLGMDATHLARMSEVTALDGSIAITLAAHQSMGLKGILLFGTEEQKQKYLPSLASGEQIAAFCLTEPSGGSDAASITTRATLSEDGQTYYLSGSKIWITNGGIADVFTVFAKTEIKNEMGEKIEKVTAFIVERDFGGVSHGKAEDKMGVRGSNTCEVYFDNTPIPAENVIGDVGAGFQVAMNVLNSGRFTSGSAGAGALKNLINLTTEHVISRTQFNKKLHEFEMIQEKLGKMAVITYAMESMSYLTAGLIDQYQEPDLSIESAMVKIYSSEGVSYCINECLQILGGAGYMKDFPYEQYLRDNRILYLFEGTNEILRLLVSMSGLQYAGKELINVVRRMRDPFNNVGFIFKTMVPRMIRLRKKEPKLTLLLHDYAHPSLVESAQMLERCLHKFHVCVKDELNTHAQNLLTRQMDLRRISDMVMDIYAMSAVIGRASRSISIGLRHCDHEAMLAHTFCHEANERIMKNLTELTIGDFNNLDENYRKLARDMVQHHGYIAEHPLTKNW